MEEIENVWPSMTDINNEKGIVDLAPYGVLRQYSDAVYDAYSKKIIGIVTARYTADVNGEKRDFVYSLYLAKTVEKDDAQVKILELAVNDDGWYPATLSILGRSRETIGIAETEEQLRKFLKAAIGGEFVRKQIAMLLK